MLESFYGLTDNPFRMSADANFRYAHRSYKKAWSYLKYALEQAEGFVLITGRPGTGKTTLILDILSELDSERIQPVNLVTNQLQGEELLRLVALEFGFQAQEYNKATLLTRIEQHALILHQQGQRILVIVDEAQNLSAHGLEELRLLSNLQSGSQSLFQIVLIGQEELRSLIYGQGIENIQQRILVSCRLEPMQQSHVQGYVEHRLGIAGWAGDPVFDTQIFPLLHRITQGVPREINLVAARLLLYGALEKKHELRVHDLLVVLNELNQEQRLAVDKAAVLAELQDATEKGPAETDSGAEDAREAVSDADRPAPSQALAAEGPETPAEQPISASETDVGAARSGPEPGDLDAEPLPEEMDPESGVTQPENPPEPTGQPETEIQETPVPPEKAADRDVAGSPTAFEPLWTDGKETEPDTERTGWEEPSEPTVPLFETDADGLPSLHATRDDEDRPQGLLTDVDDLLENEDGFGKRLGLAWRWLFYPLAIILLLLAILMQKPGDLTDQWQALKQSLAPLVNPSPGDSLPPSGKEPDVVQEGAVEGAAQGDVADDKAGRQSPADPVDPDPEQPLVQIGDEAQSGSVMRPAAVDTGDTLSIDTSKGYWLEVDRATGEMEAASQALYGQLVEWLLANPAAAVVLTGVATNGSQPMAQMRDALEQAEGVSRLLLHAGIPARRIQIESSGTESGSGKAGVHVELKPSGFSAVED